MIRALIFFLLMTTQAFAQYETEALDQALNSLFSNIESTSSVIYTETNRPFCTQKANVEVTAVRYGNTRAQRYECDVCLYADDNLFWDYESIQCDFAAR